MLLKCFAELEGKGPRQSPAPSRASAGPRSRREGASPHAPGTAVLPVTAEGRQLLIYLFNFYYVMLATFLRQCLFGFF